MQNNTETDFTVGDLENIYCTDASYGLLMEQGSEPRCDFPNSEATFVWKRFMLQPAKLSPHSRGLFLIPDYQPRWSKCPQTGHKHSICYANKGLLWFAFFVVLNVASLALWEQRAHVRSGIKFLSSSFYWLEICVNHICSESQLHSAKNWILKHVDFAESRYERSHLVLERHDRVVFGGVDVQDMEAVLPTQVVGDVSEGCAGRLGHSVVDDDHVIPACWGWKLPPGVFIVALLYLGHLVSGNGSFCTCKKKKEDN